MNDTVKLLKECDSGCRTAIDGMSAVLSKVTCPNLKEEIASSSKTHAEIGKECHKLLNSVGEYGGEPISQSAIITAPHAAETRNTLRQPETEIISGASR